jgi:hypothetical protein
MNKSGRIVFLAVACLLIGGICFFYTLRAVASYRPADTTALENALAMPGVFVAAHADIAGLKSMQSAFYGVADPQALSSALIGSHKHLADLLESQRVAPGDSLSGFVGVIGVGTGGMFHALVLTGQFDVSRWQAAIRAAFAAKPVSANGRTWLEVMLQNDDTCSSSGPFAVDVSPSRLVVAEPSVMPALLSNLERNSAAVTDIAGWQAFKKGKLVSVALLVPQSAPMAIDQPLFKMLAAAMALKATSLDMLFLGASTRLLPTPGIVLESELHSANPEWLQQTAATITAALDTAFAGEKVKALPALAAIRSAVFTAVTRDRLSIWTVLDRHTVQNLSSVAQEGVQLIFGGMAPVSSNTAAARESVTPAKELPVYQTELSGAALLPYKATFLNDAPDAVAGPFGVTIAANRISDRDPDAIEVELDIRSSAIPNLGEEFMHQSADTAIAMVSLTGATDAGGMSVLRVETCGTDRNDMPAALQPRDTLVDGKNGFEKAMALQGIQKIRLAPHVAASTVKRISGTIDLSLPVKVHMAVIAAPLSGQVVQTGDVRMLFKESGPREISYDISGRMPYVLAVRAVNDRHEYLSGSASGMGHLWGEGQSVNRQFSGTVAQVEVWVVDAVEKKSYPFTLTSAEPTFTTTSGATPYSATVTSAKEVESLPHAPDCKNDEVKADAAPLTLCVKNIAPAWNGVRASLRVNVPRHPAFTGNLSAVEVRLESLQAGSSTQPVPFRESAFAALRETGNPPMLSDAYLTVGNTGGYEALRGRTITGATGQVIVRLPRAFERLSFDLSQLGVERTAANGLKATLKEISRGSLRLQLEGPRESVVQIIAADANNQLLATSSESITRDLHDPNAWAVSLNVSAKPRYVHVIYASRVETITRPFAVTLGHTAESSPK